MVDQKTQNDIKRLIELKTEYNKIVRSIRGVDLLDKYLESKGQKPTDPYWRNRGSSYGVNLSEEGAHKEGFVVAFNEEFETHDIIPFEFIFGPKKE